MLFPCSTRCLFCLAKAEAVLSSFRRARAEHIIVLLYSERHLDVNCT
jgi:hypothetical protein